MAQFCYDVVPHDDGWAIVITPARTEAFPTRLAAFDIAVEFARKLRFVGFSINIRMRDDRRTARELPHSRRAS